MFLIWTKKAPNAPYSSEDIIEFLEGKFYFRPYPISILIQWQYKTFFDQCDRPGSATHLLKWIKDRREREAL
ncbi:MAG: hypothetical protein F6K10_13970 [Moorea sp. SIO2B7]|nr:hypothetical protein [Moorena sp. SIO2B7]